MTAVSTDILCPGIPTLIDDKENKPIVHYLKVIDGDTGNKMCDMGGCKFVLRDKEGKDWWQDGFMPLTVSKS